MTDENATVTVTEEAADPWGIEAESVTEEKEASESSDDAEEKESEESGDDSAHEEKQKPEEEELAFDGKPLPKSRRAHEINAIANERLRAKDSEIEALRRQLEERDSAVKDIFKKPEEKAPEQTDDEYLISKGYDPDEFLDDGAKKATLRLERKADKLEAEIEAAKQERQKRSESEGATEAEQKALSALNAEISGLPEAERPIAWEAVNYLQQAVAQTQIINWEATKAGREAIKEHGIEAVQAAAMKEAESIIKKTFQSIVKEGGSPLEWAAKSAKVAGFNFASGKKQRPDGKINGEALSRSQDRAGKPAIDTAGGAAPATGFTKKFNDEMEKAGWY